MWLFEARYDNLDKDSFIICIRRKIEFDGNEFGNSDNACYEHALHLALEMKRKNECLKYLKFIRRET